jgi:hypothetical protein
MNKVNHLSTEKRNDATQHLDEMTIQEALTGAYRGWSTSYDSSY